MVVRQSAQRMMGMAASAALPASMRTERRLETAVYAVVLTVLLLSVVVLVVEEELAP